MSVTLDAPDAVTAAKARVKRANGLNGAAPRSKNPRVIAARRSELTTAVIACDITTAVVKWPHLSVPQRLELIQLLMPADNTEATQVLNELRDHTETSSLAYGGA